MNFSRENAEKFFKFLNHQKLTELRIIDPQEGIKEATFVDNLNDFLAICEKWNGQANIYVGVNERFAREGKTENVGKLSIIPLDIDPVRPKGQASTDAELEIARQKMLAIKNWLEENFDCRPFIVMSGNGYHMDIKIPSITLDEFSRPAVQQKLQIFIHGIQEKFNDEKVHIDSTFDLPRVMKCPGTMSVKGDNTPERPWRMCRIVEENDVPSASILNHLIAIQKPEKAEAGFKLGDKGVKEFAELLEKDQKLRDLVEGQWKKYDFPSRSEAEMSLLTKLVAAGFSEDSINHIMMNSKIGKWQERPEAYRKKSIEKAIQFAQKTKDAAERTKPQRSWEDIGEPITFDEWRKTIMENFPELWTFAEASASTIALLLIKDVQPFALVLQGVPGSGKTTTLDFFMNFPLSHHMDKFSPRAFVSHIAQKSEEELQKIDLLPRIKDKVLITPDLTTLFGGKPDEVKETFSILTRVLDGRGLTIDSGVYGARGYKGEYPFAWLGATTPIPHAIWDLFGNLGARMYFQFVPKRPKATKKYVQQIKEKSYHQKREDCNNATLKFLKGIWRKDKVEWNSKADSDAVLERVVMLAQLVTRLRGKTNVAVRQEYGEDKAYFTEPIIEEPERAIQAFYALMRGHALVKGRTQISQDDLPLVIDVALSSAPWDRIFAFAYLLNKEKVTTTELMQDVRCSRFIALRTMKTLELLDLVDLQTERVQTEGGFQSGYTMRLRDELGWFKSAEFKRLWRSKIGDIMKPAEELDTSQFKAAQGEMGTLESFVKVYMRRIHMKRRRKGS